MNKNNKSIKCDVHDCKFQNNDENYCTLEEIKVTSENEDNSEKDNTLCDSYESIDETPE